MAEWKILSHNSSEYVNEIKEPEDIGNVILFGSTGFLGIHVLKYLLDHTFKDIYCVIRPGADTAEKRLQNMLMYYFDAPMWELFGSRIRCISGDITDPESLKALEWNECKTVFNCAAYVDQAPKGKDPELTNVKGVENLIEACLANGKRLIHVSTTAVAGINEKGALPPEKKLSEKELDIGQTVKSRYVRSKYSAEEAVLKAIEEKGLDAKIIRLGNLMSRYSDGEYQIKFVANSYLRLLRAYAFLGKVPVSALDEPVEFSPVDCSAEAVVKLATTPKDFTVFHATNGHKVQTGDVIEALRRVNVDIDVVDDDAFEAYCKEAKKVASLKDLVSLIAHRQQEKHTVGSFIRHTNRFTTKALYRLSFKWPIVTGDYLSNAFRTLVEMEFFPGK